MMSAIPQLPSAPRHLASNLSAVRLKALLAEAEMIGIEHLPHHLHAFLIRDPVRVVASYAAKRVSVRPEHLGLGRQRAYFDREADRLGHAPPVVDSADILAETAATLASLCAALEIPWTPARLSWPSGRRTTDGIWASHWYRQ